MWGSSASYAYGSAGSENAMVFLSWCGSQAAGRDRGAGPRLACRAFRLSFPAPHPADDARQQRNEDHDDDHRLDVPVDARNVAPQEVTDKQHAPDPADAPHDVI